ncbi:MAG TPA: glycosyltransferase family 39 protein [Candidatus Limnocylindria bacterium]|nr:glycosyltransferase family 39 protein [Candidatus Limnocylindria bacterium]
MMLLYLGQGLFYSRTLISTEDEESYLALGDLALRGRISLFQDELTGQRLPIPFYVLGLSQVVFGSSLWAGRLLSIALGAVVLALTVSVARRLQGEAAGLLAGFLLTTQGAIVAYYATAAYHAWSALVLMTAVWVLLQPGRRWRGPLGMAVASVLTLSRTTMVPAVPFLFGWAWVVSRTRIKRVAVVALAAIPPLVFLLWDPTHLKILAHIPLLGGLVEPLGYRSILYFQVVTAADLPTQLWSLARFARRYESWVVAAAGIAVTAVLLRRRRGRWTTRPVAEGLVAVAGLGAWLLLAHLVMFRVNFKWAIAYFPDFAPLAAVVLGVLAVRLWERPGLPRAGRAVLAGSLALALVMSVVLVRIPMMPTPMPIPFRDDPVQQINRAAGRLAELIPPGERIFFFGPAMAVHLAGRLPYLQQLMAPGTFATNDGDARTVSRSGVWGGAEIERWLGREVRYAVVNPAHLDSYAAAGRRAGVERIRALLDQRFEPIGRIDDAYWSVLEVHRRRPGDVGR